MTYALQQEAASRALLRLLTTDHRGLGGDAGVVLECRRHAGAAMLERLHQLGGVQEPQVKPDLVRVRSLGQHPVRHLVEVLTDTPRVDPGGTAPSDLLPGPPVHDATTPVDLWRCVARHLMLGNHELATSPARPWEQTPEAAWYLLADAATTTEALVVLDQQLGYAGLLPREPTDRVLGRRLIAGDVTRLAGWFGTDNSPDGARQGVSTSLGLAGGPRIHMVRRAEDLVIAQQALTGLLRPTQDRYEAGTPQERSGLLAARGLAVGQIRLAETFAGWTQEHGGRGAVLAEEFRSRIPAYRELHRTTLRLTEVEPRRSPLVMSQQSEMVMQLRSLGSSGSTPPSREALIDLNDATHELTVTLGKALRLETMTRKNILTLEARGMGLPEPRPILSSRHPFYAACRRLAEDPAPAPVTRSWAAPVHRERLRLALETTATGRARSIRGMSQTMSRSSAPGRHRTC